MTLGVPDLVNARRSIRSFEPVAVPRALIDLCIEAACLAPAPHHSRPWRWVVVDGEQAKRDLATGMGERWRADLRADGVDEVRVDELVASSHAKIENAPAVILGCLTWEGLDRYPDDARQRAEHGMALLSLGAAVENLMLTAAARGLASCWVAAPIFCPDAARDALALPDDWLAYAMVLIGRPDASYQPRPRPTVPVEDLRTYR